LQTKRRIKNRFVKLNRKFLSTCIGSYFEYA
jgi:hypothetical protein